MLALLWMEKVSCTVAEEMSQELTARYIMRWEVNEADSFMTTGSTTALDQPSILSNGN
jgi:hypothetical protein